VTVAVADSISELVSQIYSKVPKKKCLNIRVDRNHDF